MEIYGKAAAENGRQEPEQKIADVWKDGGVDVAAPPSFLMPVYEMDLLHGQYQERNDEEGKEDSRNPRGNRITPKGFQGQRRSAKEGENQPGYSPKDTSGDHGDDQGGIEGVQPLGQKMVHEPCHGAIGGQLCGKGKTVGNQGDGKEQSPKQGREKPHCQAVGPAAEESAQKNRNMAETQGRGEQICVIG